MGVSRWIELADRVKIGVWGARFAYEHLSRSRAGLVAM